MLGFKSPIKTKAPILGNYLYLKWQLFNMHNLHKSWDLNQFLREQKELSFVQEWVIFFLSLEALPAADWGGVEGLRSYGVREEVAMVRGDTHRTSDPTQQCVCLHRTLLLSSRSTSHKECWFPTINNLFLHVAIKDFLLLLFCIGDLAGDYSLDTAVNQYVFRGCTSTATAYKTSGENNFTKM